MKLFIANEEGVIEESREVRIVGEGDIVIRLERYEKKEDIKKMEEDLAEKFGRKIILLDKRYGEIMVVPP